MSNEIPTVHIRQTRMITVKLAGATHYWLQDNTSWGNLPSETQTARDARAKILAAERRKSGKGSIYTVDLPDEQAESLWSILDSIAGAGESMSAQERGDDTYNYRMIRRDADRIRESLAAIGWTPDAVAEKSRYRDYPDRLDLVICDDCSTRTLLCLIERDEIEEHDTWHAEVAAQ